MRQSMAAGKVGKALRLSVCGLLRRYVSNDTRLAMTNEKKVCGKLSVCATYVALLLRKVRVKRSPTTLRSSWL